MLDVIEESRQRAMAQREAALDHLATVALQAIVEGADVRDVARRCGFAAVEKKPARPDGPVSLGMSGGLMSYMLGAEQPEPTPDERFADWLAQAIKKLVLEGMEEPQS